MKISDMISMCIGNLFRRKMRTLLTVVGVIVGTCSIVVMISIGIGMNVQLDMTIAQMGSRLTMINVMNYGYSGQGENQAVLDDTAITKMQALPNVEVATPIYTPRYLQAGLYAGKDDRYKIDYLGLQGMYASALPKMGYQLLEGEYPDGKQLNPKKPINILVGEFLAYDFEDTKKKFDNYRWPETDASGKVIQEPFVDINKAELMFKSDKMEEDSPESTRISRILKPVGRIKEDWDKGYETSRGVLMDIDDLKELEKEYIKANKIKINKSEEQQGYHEATVLVKSMDDVDPVETQINAMGFETRSMETVRKPMQENARKQQLFLGTMGGISLFVAAIGIMNTMIMSIYERTREIGVMKVLGCKVNNIRSIFLMEAGVIGFLGGIIGVGISYGISMAMNYFSLAASNKETMSGGGMMGSSFMMSGMRGMDASQQAPISVIPLWLVGMAIVFATLIGILSGILPANRAMKISALEAIKHE